MWEVRATHSALKKLKSHLVASDTPQFVEVIEVANHIKVSSQLGVVGKQAAGISATHCPPVVTPCSRGQGSQAGHARVTGVRGHGGCGSPPSYQVDGSGGLGATGSVVVYLSNLRIHGDHPGGGAPPLQGVRCLDTTFDLLT